MEITYIVLTQIKEIFHVLEVIWTNIPFVIKRQ